MLFQAGGRIAPSHVLLVAEGERRLSDGLRTYRKVSLATMLWLWSSAALGVAGRGTHAVCSHPILSRSVLPRPG